MKRLIKSNKCNHCIHNLLFCGVRVCGHFKVKMSDMLSDGCKEYELIESD